MCEIAGEIDYQILTHKYILRPPNQ